MALCFMAMTMWLFPAEAQEVADTTSVLSVPAVPSVPKTTPIDTDEVKKPEILYYYDLHGHPLKEPVRFLTEPDTVAKPKSTPVYPAFNGIGLGVNFGDAILMAFGQKHCGFDLWANASIHNWIFPTLEIGIGWGKDTPTSNNYTVRVNPSVYAKLGIDYNFLYKSNPDYRFFIGLRGGFSHYKWKVDGITVSDGYWEVTTHPHISPMSSTAFYGDLLAGLQVKIVRNFSLGWNARWHFMIRNKNPRGNAPWYIPGFGTSETPFSISVSAIIAIPAKSRPHKEDPPELSPHGGEGL